MTAAARPVVPRDMAASLLLLVAGALAFGIAAEVWTRPVAAALLLLGVIALVVLVGATARRRPLGNQRRWLAGVEQVPRGVAAVAPAGSAARSGALLGAGAGLALLAAVLGVVAGFGSASGLLVPLGFVLGLSSDRLVTARVLGRWERERGVVLCRLPVDTRLILLHETDLARMVVVPRPVGPARSGT